MTTSETHTTWLSEVSRRDVLRIGAGAGVLGLSAISDATTADGGDSFLVKPYLQLGDAPRLRKVEQMVVSWHAAGNDAKWNVECRGGRNGDWISTKEPKSTPVEVAGITPHHVFRAMLMGLAPGAEFAYRVLRNDEIVFESTGRARKNRSQPIRCIVMGDCGAGSPEQRKVAFQASRIDSDFVMIPGDIVYNNGLISEYRAKFWPVYSPNEGSPEAGAPLLRSVPFLGGLGQHDTGQTLDTYSDGFAYYMYWSFPLNGPLRDVDDGNAFPLGGTEARRKSVLAATEDRYPRMANYSFDYGDSHWAVLDTWNPYCNWNDPKLRDWLRNDLNSTDAAWKFVCSYLPPFNSSTEYPDTQKMRVIADILEETGVSIVFCGYAHSYQVTYPLRFKPTRKLAGPVSNPKHKISGTFELDREFDGKKKTKPNGVLYITTGGGGNPGLHSPSQTDNPDTWQPFTVKYNANVNQLTDLRIEKDHLMLRQIDLNGKLIDEFQVSR